MKSIHNNTMSYEYDDHGIQGLFRTWHINGQAENLQMRKDHKYHGEYIRYNMRGKIVEHFYMDGDREVHDFKKNPLSDEERMLLVLKHGAPLLPKDI